MRKHISRLSNVHNKINLLLRYLSHLSFSQKNLKVYMYICIFYYIERVLNVNFLIQLDIDVIF